MTSSTKESDPDESRGAKVRASGSDAAGLKGLMADHPDRQARPDSPPDAAEMEEVVRKTVVRMVDRIGMRENDLAGILGVSSYYVSKMRNGRVAPALHSDPFENALLLIRTLDALWSFVATDDGVNRYLYSPHRSLNQMPIEMMKCPEGLVDMTRYVESKIH